MSEVPRAMASGSLLAGGMGEAADEHHAASAPEMRCRPSGSSPMSEPSLAAERAASANSARVDAPNSTMSAQNAPGMEFRSAQRCGVDG
jgi:hypothetical protein